MARKGLAYAVAAKIQSETPNVALVYETGFKLAKAIEANISYTTSSSPLYGDNVIAENDNSKTGGTIALNITHIVPEDRVKLMGDVKVSPDDYYVETAANAPEVGFGYVTIEQENNVNKYYAWWVYKTQFAMNEDSAATKAESTDWKTPSLEGTLMGVYPDVSGDAHFRAYGVFDSFVEAKAWVNNWANIPLDKVATPVATPPAGAVPNPTDVVLTSATPGATIYYTTDGSAPSEGSTEYTAPIKITSGKTIKAIAVRMGMNDSDVLTAAYTIGG